MLHLFMWCVNACNLPTIIKNDPRLLLLMLTYARKLRRRKKICTKTKKGQIIMQRAIEVKWRVYMSNVYVYGVCDEHIRSPYRTIKIEYWLQTCTTIIHISLMPWDETKARQGTLMQSKVRQINIKCNGIEDNCMENWTKTNQQKCGVVGERQRNTHKKIESLATAWEFELMRERRKKITTTKTHMSNITWKINKNALRID